MNPDAESFRGAMKIRRRRRMKRNELELAARYDSGASKQPTAAATTAENPHEMDLPHDGGELQRVFSIRPKKESPTADPSAALFPFAAAVPSEQQALLAALWNEAVAHTAILVEALSSGNATDNSRDNSSQDASASNDTCSSAPLRPLLHLNGSQFPHTNTERVFASVEDWLDRRLAESTADLSALKGLLLEKIRNVTRGDEEAETELDAYNSEVTDPSVFGDDPSAAGTLFSRSSYGKVTRLSLKSNSNSNAKQGERNKNDRKKLPHNGNLDDGVSDP